MEITGYSSAFSTPLTHDNFNLTAASPFNNVPDFEEMFERARAKTAASSVNVTTYSAKQPIDKTDELYGLCLELESFIIKSLLNTMRNTVQKSGLIDDSFASQMYEDMLYDEYAKDFTKSANFGLAEQAYRQLRNLY